MEHEQRAVPASDVVLLYCHFERGQLFSDDRRRTAFGNQAPDLLDERGEARRLLEAVFDDQLKIVRSARYVGVVLDKSGKIN